MEKGIFDSIAIKERESYERQNRYVGVSDEPAPECDISKVDRLVLTSVGEWPYYASCHVDRTDGRIEMLEVKKPD